jgi:hypothetical protein
MHRQCIEGVVNTKYGMRGMDYTTSYCHDYVLRNQHTQQAAKDLHSSSPSLWLLHHSLSLLSHHHYPSLIIMFVPFTLLPF